MKRMSTILLALWVCISMCVRGYAESDAFTLSDNITSVDVQTIVKTAENIQYSEIYFSASISSISITLFPFSHFNDVQNYSVDPKNPSFCSIDGVLFSKDGRTLVAFPCGRTGDYTIPEGVEIIGSFAFHQASIETVVFPSSVKIVEDGAFWESSIERVEFNEGLEQIGKMAFECCFSLQEVALPSTLKSIGVMAFASCPLKNVVIPEGVEALGAEAFVYCRLESIRLPSTLVECGALIIGRNNLTDEEVTTTIIVPLGSMIDMYITETMGYYPIVRESD